MLRQGVLYPQILILINSFFEKFYTKYTTLSSIYYLLKLEGDFKVSIYREVNGKNNKEIFSFSLTLYPLPFKMLAAVE